jgi:hypothetical protein
MTVWQKKGDKNQNNYIMHWKYGKDKHLRHPKEG